LASQKAFKEAFCRTPKNYGSILFGPKQLQVKGSIPFGGLVPDCSRATPLFGVRRRLTKANYINLS